MVRPTPKKPANKAGSRRKVAEPSLSRAAPTILASRPRRVRSPHADLETRPVEYIPKDAPRGESLRGEGEPDLLDCLERRLAVRSQAPDPIPARRASYRGSERVAAAGGAAPTNAQAEPSDEIFKRITNTALAPYVSICYLLITAKNGKLLQGTGWLAGPRTVVTAGHNVFQRNLGNWAQRIDVVLARNGDAQVATIPTTHFETVDWWIDQGLQAFDYGAAILPQAGDWDYLGYRTEDDADLRDLLVTIAGYPYANKQGVKFTQGSMWGDNGFLTGVGANQIFYDLETYEGMSGAPVVVTLNNKRYALGIHNYGDSSLGNYATRITSVVWDNIRAWVTENP